MINYPNCLYKYFRQSIDEEWEVCGQSTEFGWMEMAKPVMKLYTEATDGSSIETKESALVWQYRDADPGFGFSQAKEMLDHLESVLANEPVAVRSGQFIVEVKPQANITIRVSEFCYSIAFHDANCGSVLILFHSIFYMKIEGNVYSDM